MIVNQIYEMLSQVDIKLQLSENKKQLTIVMTEKESGSVSVESKPTSFVAKKSRTIDKVKKDEEKKQEEFQTKFDKGVKMFRSNKPRIAQAIFESIMELAGSEQTKISLSNWIRSCKEAYDENANGSSQAEALKAEIEKQRDQPSNIPDHLKQNPMTEEEAFPKEPQEPSPFKEDDGFPNFDDSWPE